MCKLYSTDCGADAWLQFDESDNLVLQGLNGKCVVVISRKGDTCELDEYNPLGSGMLKVHKSKLFNEGGEYGNPNYVKQRRNADH